MSFAYSPSIIKDGLVFYMDAANPISYVSGNTTCVDLMSGEVGALENGTGFSTENNGSWSFDGTDDEIDFGDVLGDVFQGTKQFTIDVWCNRNVVSSSNVIISRWLPTGNQREWYFAFRSTFPDLIFGISTDGSGASGGGERYVLTTGNGAPSDNWLNLVVSWDNTKSAVADEIQIYANGKQQTLDLIGPTSPLLGSDTIATKTPSLIVGDIVNNSGLSGNFSMCRIYNRNLSAAEALQNYNSLKGRFGL
jgi:hypothetical protein